MIAYLNKLHAFVLQLQALKMMTRWLLGVKSDDNKSATSTLRLLYTLVLHEGDLMEKGRISRAEMSRLRLQAACCILKLVQEPAYQELLTLEQFQTIALLLNVSDLCPANAVLDFPTPLWFPYVQNGSEESDFLFWPCASSDSCHSVHLPWC